MRISGNVWLKWVKPWASQPGKTRPHPQSWALRETVDPWLHSLHLGSSMVEYTIRIDSRVNFVTGNSSVTLQLHFLRPQFAHLCIWTVEICTHQLLGWRLENAHLPETLKCAKCSKAMNPHWLYELFHAFAGAGGWTAPGIIIHLCTMTFSWVNTTCALKMLTFISNSK